tara:strand:- start:44 stop:2392 length:2349 start_codon:yes stop_codon:yes gene_type:complete
MADKYNPTQFKDLMGYLTRPSEDRKRMREYFETNDPVEFGKEIIKRAVPIDFSEVPVLENVSIGMAVPNRLEAGANFNVGGGELMFSAGKQGQDEFAGIGFRKEFSDGGRMGFKDKPLKNFNRNPEGDRRMYSGRMMTEEQIQAIRDRRKVPKKEGMVYDKETKEFRPRKESVVSEKMSKASAEVKATKTKNKLENFIKNFKETNGRLPGIMEIRNGADASTKSIKKYLTEGIDYTKTSLTEAAVKGGQKSAIVRAVSEGQDPSYVKRAKTLDEASKFLSVQDKADFKKINDGKKFINNYFKANPEAINTTEFGKNIKQLLSFRMDKNTGAIFSKVRPDDYYIQKAKEGKLFDIFDIKAVKEGGRSLRFPTNINITPGQFNQVFIQNQVGKYFAKGANPEALKNVEDILNKYKLRVKLPEVGYVGTDNPVAVSRATGEFPKITDTLKSMKAPQEVLDQFKDVKNKISQDLGKLGCPTAKFALGGRVKFSSGSACVIKGREKLESILKKGVKVGSDEQVLANGILKAGRGLKNAFALRGLFGPAAIALTALTEGGILGYDMLSQGKTFKEAMGDSLFNLMLGDDYRFNNNFLVKGGTFDERLDKLKFNPNQKQLIDNFRTYVSEAQALGDASLNVDKAQRLLDDTGQIKGRLGKDRTPTLEKNLAEATAAKQAADQSFQTRVQDIDFAKQLQSGMTEGQDLMGKAINLAELQQLGSVDQNIYGKGFEGPIAKEKRQERILELLPTALNFAGGGIAKQAGDSSGKPPLSGPTPQGLPGLLKRGI